MGLAKSQAQQHEALAADELVVALDALRIAITIFDADGRLNYVNAHFRHIFHAFPDRALGMAYADMVRREIASGEISPSNYSGNYAGDGEDYVAQRLDQLQQGQYAPCDILMADNRVVEIKARRTAEGLSVLLWSDVTQARHQFARLEDAISLSADAFAFFDSQDRFLTGNALYARLAGVSLASVQGRKFADVVAAVARSGRIILDGTPEEWLERRLKAHQSPASAYTLQTREGSAYLVRDRATPDGGRAIVFTDVTDKTRAETALARAENALNETRSQAQQQTGYLSDLTRRLDQASAEADSAKTTLLRTMSHELKTPLNAILGFSDLMRTLADTLTPAQIREYSDLVHLGGSNLLKLLNQIMDLTKISAGRYELRKTAVDAGSLAWIVRENFLPQAAQKAITIDADACPVGLLALTDEGVLTAMIGNLVDNAVTFTHPGGAVRLTVTQADKIILVRVEDNGPGVDPDDLARIQRPFEHIASAAEHSKGAGLGLTLVKAFAELHGGALELSSARGQGFAAAITLPAAS